MNQEDAKIGPTGSPGAPAAYDVFGQPLTLVEEPQDGQRIPHAPRPTPKERYNFLTADITERLPVSTLRSHTGQDVIRYFEAKLLAYFEHEQDV